MYEFVLPEAASHVQWGASAGFAVRTHHVDVDVFDRQQNTDSGQTAVSTMLGAAAQHRSVQWCKPTGIILKYVGIDAFRRKNSCDNVKISTLAGVAKRRGAILFGKIHVDSWDGKERHHARHVVISNGAEKWR